MRKINGQYIYSPSDLIVFMESQFDSWMDRYYLDYPDEVKPQAADDVAVILQKHGARYEGEFLASLEQQGKRSFCVSDFDRQCEEMTLNAMKEGYEVIYQGVLSSPQFAGKTDFLMKVPGASSFGDWSYEAWDTKLAKKPKPYFIVQLCCYAEMLEQIQGARPEKLTVVLGDKSTKDFRTNDFFYFYKQLKNSFLEFQAAFDKNNPPEAMEAGPFSRWADEAERRLEEADHLSRVANIRKIQIRKLKAGGIMTLEELATTSLTHVPKMEASTFNTLRQQAQLQMQTRREKKTFQLVLPADPDDPRRGLSLLPPHSEMDVFFDMEGYPLLDGGLEYLFGAVYFEQGIPKFKDWWAHNREEEKRAFEQFIDWVFARWRQDQRMHVYHYAAYEVAAMRRLMGRHATREEEVDELLRNEVFVDLYQIVRQGLRVGEPSYSIKNIEHLYRSKREGDVSTAADSVVFYERWIEEPDGSSWNDSKILNDIRNYNKDDCDSTQQLTDWLRRQQRAYNIAYREEVRNQRKESDAMKAKRARAQFAKQMLAAISKDRSSEPEKWRIQELLAWLLEFHDREAKPCHWRMFDRHKMTEQQLIDDFDCLGGLVRTSAPPATINRSLGYEFAFDPNQDTKMKVGDKCFFAHDLSTRTEIAELDRNRGLVTIKSGKNCPAPPQHLSLIPDEHVSAGVIADSILRVAQRWNETGRLEPALDDFLHRREPRLAGKNRGTTIVSDSSPSSLQDSIDAIVNMDKTSLCIQGPPGSGKTTLAASAIVELLRRGRRVGVTSNSHKAIEHVLMKAVEAATKQGVPARAFKIGKDGSSGSKTNLPVEIEFRESGREFFASGQTFNLVGGTAWAFSHPDAEAKLDYLFVDEAGQVSMANLVGMSPSTQNIVLLGDQMQLEQPIQGSHPGESGQSILDYLLQDHATIPQTLGIFLSTTRRMHPELCKVVSSAVYEDRLHSEAGNESQVLIMPPALSERFGKEAGIIFVPVKHEGNTQGSVEEADAIAHLASELQMCQVFDKQLGAARKITLNDILIVAPYNMQVRLIASRLPDARVASVDKFQGQEAPIVILSMCASEGTASPRGMEFLLSKNRLNVAISRAKSSAFVVANPDLVRTPCTTIEQMKQLNFFCQIVEAGSERRAGLCKGVTTYAECATRDA